MAKIKRDADVVYLAITRQCLARLGMLSKNTANFSNLMKQS